MNIKEFLDNKKEEDRKEKFVIEKDELIKDLEELDGLLDSDINIQWNNLLNIHQIKRKQRSKWKKNKHIDTKGINKGKKEKRILETAHERLLKSKRKKDKKK